MKKSLLLIILQLFIGGCLHAQQAVRLQIDHQLNGSAFDPALVAQNDLGNDFKTNRLQYYLAEIVLVHDGGQFTPVNNTWFLVDANQPFDEALGNFPITNLEAIRFAVGVEQPTNHQDPAGYPANHPLAPKNPSMHWGWQAGYRFVCMEGTSGANTSQVFEIHALGNNNYLTQQISTMGLTQSNDLVVKLVADYTQAVQGIDLSSGLIRHGTNLESADLLQNFALKVFQSHEGNSAVLSQNELDVIAPLHVFPNPSRKGFQVQVKGEWNWQLIDLLGRTLQQGATTGSSAEFKISVTKSGVYLLRLTNSNGQTLTQKLIRN